MLNVWRLGKCESPFSWADLKDNKDFMIYSDLFFSIIIAICHLLPNHETKKEDFKQNSNSVFYGHGVPSIDQKAQLIDNEDLMSRIRDCNIFSFNHYKVDDSYPKRLWRLSKNCALKYDQKYWSYCYELKDCLLDYLKDNQ